MVPVTDSTLESLEYYACLEAVRVLCGQWSERSMKVRHHQATGGDWRCRVSDFGTGNIEERIEYK